MATYWKEVVNFGGDYCEMKLLLSVYNGVGVCKFNSAGKLGKGNIQLLVKEGSCSQDFEGGVCEFSFETVHREYCVRIYQGEKLICFGGNSKNLRHEYALPKIYATDTFEERVADFNYFETELGDKGKSLDSILQSEDKKAKAEVENQIKKEDTTEEIMVENQVKNQVKKQEKNADIKEDIQAEIKETESESHAEKISSNTAENIKTHQNIKQAKSVPRKKAGEKNFFDLAKPQVEKMLVKFPKEEFLEEVLDNSKWVKVGFSKGVEYAVGMIYADDLVGYIGYGVKGRLDNPPKFENPQFVPFDISSPNGEGYFLIFQRADNGEKV